MGAGQSRDNTIAITWKDLYCWFGRRSSDSFWAREFVEYMQIFERKMLAKYYDIRGTITVFDGLRFDTDSPYTYREDKRLIRLIGDQLQSRKDLHRIGVDPGGNRRPAITGSGTDHVWDFLPLVVARNAKQFTSFPHLTIALHQARAIAAVTVPNGVKGGFRTKLAECGPEGFPQLLAELEKGLRPIIKRSQGAKPIIYVTQRHYKSQRSPAEVDAHLEVDLRTTVPGVQNGVRYQPQWLDAIFEVLVHKKSNMQLGVEVRFSYASSPGSVGKFWFGEGSKVVIEAGFTGFIGTKAVRFSRGQFYFVVESLDGSAGKSPFGAKPVENQLPVVA